MDSSSFGEGSGPNLRPYAVQPDLDYAFDVPIRPISSPAAAAARVPSSRPAVARVPPHEAFVQVDPDSSALRGFTAAGLIGFASTALIMPLDVAKTLLQVQWIPREEVMLAELEPEERESGAEEDEFSDEGEAEAYFSDLSERASSIRLDGATIQGARGRPKRDKAGYIQRQSVFDDGTRPEHVLPVVVTGGVWEMIKELVKSKYEGVFSLWKGQLTTFIADSLETVIRPFFSLLLATTLTPNLAGLSVLESPRPGVSLLLEVSARVITSLMLSPLDLIRTRLIVQSSAPRFRKYRGPMHAFRSIIEEEGGLKSIYLHANLLIPTIADAVIRSTLALSAPLLVERVFRIRADASPIAYGMAEFVLSTASLFVVLPLETVRRRLQLQYRARSVTRGRPYRACVEIRPVPYAGVVDALYRIVVEETSTVPEQIAARKGRSRKNTGPTTASQVQANGIGQLFRGLQVGVAANALVLMLGLMGERENLRAVV